MTKTFRPFLSPPELVVDEPEPDVELDELHAASTEHATRSTAGPETARLRERRMTESFQLRDEKTKCEMADRLLPPRRGDRTSSGGADPGPRGVRGPVVTHG